MPEEAPNQEARLEVQSSYLVAGPQLVPVLEREGATGAVLLASGQVEHVGRAGGALHVRLSVQYLKTLSITDSSNGMVQLRIVEVPLSEEADDVIDIVLVVIVIVIDGELYLHVVEVPLSEKADGDTFGCATDAVRCVHLDEGTQIVVCSKQW